MREMRMPKGWTLVGTNGGFNGCTPQELKQRVAKADKVIRNTKRMEIKDLNKEADKYFAAKLSLKTASEAGKLNTKAQKAKIKAEKAAARKEKRIAKKSA
jgi:ABC-type phosphate transport system auxiliary subunit